MLVNLFVSIDGCANTQIAYYKDTQCTNYLYTNPVNATYLSCSKTSNTGTQNLLSMQMNCAVGTTTTLPLPATSYVYTEFYNNSKLTATSNTGCASSVNTFNAYPINTCYSYNNYSSALYTCNNSMVMMHEYYGSKSCQMSNSSESESDLLILPVGCTLTKNVSQALSYVKKYVGVGCYPVSTSSSNSEALSDGAVAGIVVGSVIGAALLVGVVSFVVLGAGTSTAAGAGTGAAVTGGAMTAGTTATGATAAATVTANPLVIPVAHAV